MAGPSFLVPLDTLKPRPLIDKPFQAERFSPDGKWMIGTPGQVWKKDDPTRIPLSVVSVADGTEREVKLPAAISSPRHVCWSPDGKRIAYHWWEMFSRPGEQDAHASRVTVADADGSNPKTIIRRENDHSISGLDWR